MEPVHDIQKYIITPIPAANPVLDVKYQWIRKRMRGISGVVVGIVASITRPCPVRPTASVSES